MPTASFFAGQLAWLSVHCEFITVVMVLSCHMAFLTKKQHWKLNENLPKLQFEFVPKKTTQVSGLGQGRLLRFLVCSGAVFSSRLLRTVFWRLESEGGGLTQTQSSSHKIFCLLSGLWTKFSSCGIVSYFVTPWLPFCRILPSP